MVYIVFYFYKVTTSTTSLYCSELNKSSISTNFNAHSS